MRSFILFIAIIASTGVFAQINKVTLQASGLTCSMCSNSINKALQTIPYVDQVKANIKNSSFEISFKPGAQVNFDQLKKKVEDAGFFVAKFTADVYFNNQQIGNDDHVLVNGLTVHFLHVKEQTLSGIKTIQILDKGFVPAKEYKKNAAFTKMTCYKTGMMDSCCPKSNATASRIFHVTI